MNKINIWQVLLKHYKTMSDQQGSTLYLDVFIHYIIPTIISAIICLLYGTMKPSIAALFVNFGAITTALLMSAVIMIYDQKQKTIFKIADIKDNKKPTTNLSGLEINKTVYEQLCHNVAYAILTSIILVIASVVISFFPDKQETLNIWYFSVPAYLLSYVAYTAFFTTIITFLMVIKRFSSILDN
ncbi:MULTISPECIES: hypothetical protein [Enterobacter cloacae complex]|uniref:hypothetical protein n=1 Tax=Enterobacter cloacae complex TaxID=354276 RepID=UPI00178220F0|nr:MULTISPECIES: hypothetical protein [Enterobacter cloacae complex]MBD8456835.1 hypothetical protein [Enterobacter cloacae]MBY7159829.1 hypothetical protein [Enterobacter hormaechei]